MKATKILMIIFLITISCGLFFNARSESLSGYGANRFSDTGSQAFIKKAQSIIDNYRRKTGTPGISVAIYDKGKTFLLVSGNEGDSRHTPVTAETDFAMGSIQKVFTTALLAISIIHGKATIDDPAAKYLVGPHGGKVKSEAPFWNITLKNLVTHTSALPRNLPDSRQRIGENLFHDRPLQPIVIKYLNSWHPEYPPGTQYKYSNLGFVLTGWVAVTLGNKPYTKLLLQDITRPLGMIHTGELCSSPAQGCAIAHKPGGSAFERMPVGLWTTAADMLRFMEANLGALKLSPELSKAIEMTHKKLFDVNNVHAIGMGWERWHKGGFLLISKDGIDSGFSSWIGFEPKQQRGVAILCNGGNRPVSMSLGMKLLAASVSTE